MPQTVIQLFQAANRSIPFQEWLEDLEHSEPKACKKCLALLLRLESLGHELRRPAADFLRDGIYELRFRIVKVQYRVLYFFYGQNVVVLSEGISGKKDKVSDVAINRAVSRKKLVEGDPDGHITSWETTDGDN